MAVTAAYVALVGAALACAVPAKAAPVYVAPAAGEAARRCGLRAPVLVRWGRRLARLLHGAPLVLTVLIGCITVIHILFPLFSQQIAVVFQRSAGQL